MSWCWFQDSFFFAFFLLKQQSSCFYLGHQGEFESNFTESRSRNLTMASSSGCLMFELNRPHFFKVVLGETIRDRKIVSSLLIIMILYHHQSYHIEIIWSFHLLIVFPVLLIYTINITYFGTFDNIYKIKF